MITTLVKKTKYHKAILLSIRVIVSISILCSCKSELKPLLRADYKISQAIRQRSTIVIKDEANKFNLYIDEDSIWQAGDDRITTIPVCWQATPGNQARGRELVREAVTETWGFFSNIDFTGWGLCQQGAEGIIIRVSDANTTPASGSGIDAHPRVDPDKGPGTDARFGSKLDGINAGVVFNFTFNNWACGMSTNARRINVYYNGSDIQFRSDHTPCRTKDIPTGYTLVDNYQTSPRSLELYKNHLGPRLANRTFTWGISTVSYWPGARSHAQRDLNEFAIKALAVHEFGHLLGYWHEQNRPDNPATCTNGVGSQPGGTQVGSWDESSVMNYCNPRWNNYGVLSTTDILGTQQFYGIGRRFAGTLVAIFGSY